jgi:hypothetical protein
MKRGGIGTLLNIFKFSRTAFEVKNQNSKVKNTSQKSKRKTASIPVFDLTFDFILTFDF